MSLAFFNQLRARIADHPQLFQSRSVLGPRRVDGNRLSEGKGCPPNVIIIGTDGSGLSVLDAGAIGGTGAGTGLALATTARPKSRGRSRTFHVRTSQESLPSPGAASRGRLGLGGSRGKTPHSNCMKGSRSFPGVPSSGYLTSWAAQALAWLIAEPKGGLLQLQSQDLPARWYPALQEMEPLPHGCCLGGQKTAKKGSVFLTPAFK